MGTRNRMRWGEIPTRSRAIWLKCFDCVGGSPVTGRGYLLIRNCKNLKCPLWPYRRGKGYTTRAEFLEDRERCRTYVSDYAERDQWMNWKNTDDRVE